MQISFSKRLSSVILPSIILFTITILLVSIFIRNLDGILHLAMGQDGESYAAIFGQLQDAELTLPIIVILLLSVLFAILISRTQKIVPALLLGLVAVIILFVVSLWFTNVNSIRFGTVLLFLLNALRYGIL